MRYIINDLDEDQIIVAPIEKTSVGGRIALDFAQQDGNAAMMTLDDRLAEDLIHAIRQSLAESERRG